MALMPAPARSDSFLETATRIAAGSAVFRSHCRRCHQLDPDLPGYGPALSGIIGRPAGSRPDYSYALAPPETPIIWTRDSLRFLMDGPAGTARDAGDRCVGEPSLDPVRREALIDFLEATRSGPAPHDT